MLYMIRFVTFYSLNFSSHRIASHLAVEWWSLETSLRRLCWLLVMHRRKKTLARNGEISKQLFSPYRIIKAIVCWYFLPSHHILVKSGIFVYLLQPTGSLPQSRTRMPTRQNNVWESFKFVRLDQELMWIGHDSCKYANADTYSFEKIIQSCSEIHYSKARSFCLAR